MRTWVALVMMPAPLVAAVRAALVLASVPEPGGYGVLFAIGGTLSGIGMLGLVYLTWRTPQCPWVLAGAAIALVGHNVVPRVAPASLGPGLVHLGTATLLSPWRRLALVAGPVAAMGAWLRPFWPVVGNALLLLGILGTFAVLVSLVRPGRRVRPAHPPGPRQHIEEPGR